MSQLSVSRLKDAGFWNTSGGKINNFCFVLPAFVVSENLPFFCNYYLKFTRLCLELIRLGLQSICHKNVYLNAYSSTIDSTKLRHLFLTTNNQISTLQHRRKTLKSSKQINTVYCPINVLSEKETKIFSLFHVNSTSRLGKGDVAKNNNSLGTE